MSDSDEMIERRLAELGQRTLGIRARSGFVDAVMLAVATEPRASFEHLLLRSAKRLVPLGVLAAALSLAWAAVTERSTDAAFAAADDSVEVQW